MWFICIIQSWQTFLMIYKLFVPSWICETPLKRLLKETSFKYVLGNYLNIQKPPSLQINCQIYCDILTLYNKQSDNIFQSSHPSHIVSVLDCISVNWCKWSCLSPCGWNWYTFGCTTKSELKKMSMYLSRGARMRWVPEDYVMFANKVLESQVLWIKIKMKKFSFIS
jgi:hypothetical protein